MVVTDIAQRVRTDEALRDANRFNTEIVSQAGEGIIVYDQDLRYVVWNRFMESMTGARAEDVLGRKALDLFPHLGEQGVDKLLKHALNGETVTSPDVYFYSTFTDRKGWVVGTYAPHRNSRGEIIGVIATLKDITERKRAEDALQEAKQAAEYSKAQYEQAVSMISDIVWRYDVNAQGENISTYISPVVDRLLGLPDGTVGNSFDKYFSHVHPDDLPAAQKALAEGIRTLGKDKTAEYRLRKADGTTLWVRSKGSAHRQDDGRIIVFGTTIDITDLKQAEEELKRTQSSMKIAMDLVKVVRWEYDVETDMFTFDDQFYTLYGTTAEREDGPLMSSQDYAQKFIPPEDAPLVAEEIGKSLATTDPNFTSQVEHRIIRADGTEGVIAVRYAIVKDDKGRTIKTYGANQDITKRKRAEEALRKAHDELEMRVKERTEELARKNAEMERFIYTVSHDLRTPLISMSGFLGFIEQDAQKGDLERMKADLKIVSDSVSHMDRLLQSTLELSRIGRVISFPEDVPFRDIAGDALSQIHEKIKHMGVAVSIAPTCQLFMWTR